MSGYWQGMLIMILVMVISQGAQAYPPEQSRQTISIQARGKAEVGKTAPWFSGWTADSKVVNLNKLSKEPGTKVVAMVFFATWCTNCKFGLKMLADNLNRLKEAGVNLVLVDYLEPVKEVEPWLKQMGLEKVVVVYDKFGEVSRSFGAARKVNGAEGEEAVLPLTVIMDPSGTVRAMFGEEGSDYVERILEAASGK